jgi:hypothetical protein
MKSEIRMPKLETNPMCLRRTKILVTKTRMSAQTLFFGSLSDSNFELVSDFEVRIFGELGLETAYAITTN